MEVKSWHICIHNAADLEPAATLQTIIMLECLKITTKVRTNFLENIFKLFPIPKRRLAVRLGQPLLP